MRDLDSNSQDELTYVGHATTLLRLDGTSVLTDPMLRRRLGPLRRHGERPGRELAGDADLALVSHLHRDHFDRSSLRRLSPGTPLLVPKGAGALASKMTKAEVVELAPGESLSIEGIEVLAVEASHGGNRDPWNEDSVKPLGYVLGAGGRRIYFAGDTDLFDGMTEFGPVDVALLPVWGWGPKLGPGHLDPAGAAEALTLLRPRLAVPIHWGTFYPAGLRLFRPDPLRDPPHEFKRIAGEVAPAVEVRVLQPGSSTSLEGE